MISHFYHRQFVKDVFYLVCAHANIILCNRVGVETLSSLLGMLHPLFIRFPQISLAYEWQSQSQAYFPEDEGDLLFRSILCWRFTGSQSFVSSLWWWPTSLHWSHDAWWKLLKQKSPLHLFRCCLMSPLICTSVNTGFLFWICWEKMLQCNCIICSPGLVRIRLLW